MEVYSLHATKPFAAGEGGAIQAGRDWAARLRSAINFGLPWQPGGTPSWGINGKMPEVTAAIGLAALAGYAEALRTRQMQAARYCELIGRFNRVVIHRGIADAPWQVFPCLLPSPQAASDFAGIAHEGRHHFGAIAESQEEEFVLGPGALEDLADGLA